MGPPYETLVFTLHNKFKFCFQFMLTSCLPKSTHEKYTLALKGEHGPSHWTWYHGAREGWKSSGLCGGATVSGAKLHPVAQGSSGMSVGFIITELYNLGCFERDLVKSYCNTKLLSSFSQEQPMEIYLLLLLWSYSALSWRHGNSEKNTG